MAIGFEVEDGWSRRSSILKQKSISPSCSAACEVGGSRSLRVMVRVLGIEIVGSCLKDAKRCSSILEIVCKEKGSCDGMCNLRFGGFGIQRARNHQAVEPFETFRM